MAGALESLTPKGVVARFVFALLLVYATWNPCGKSFVHWVVMPLFDGATAESAAASARCSLWHWRTCCFNRASLSSSTLWRCRWTSRMRLRLLTRSRMTAHPLARNIWKPDRNSVSASLKVK